MRTGKARNSKSEIRNKFKMIKNQKVSNKPGGTSGQWQVTGGKDGFEVSVLRFVFRIRICFGFRASDFEISF